MSTRLLVCAAAVLLGVLFARCQQPPPWADDGRVKLGVGDLLYAWDGAWLDLPEEMTLGNTHGGFALDRAGRIYFSTDSAHAIIVLDASGGLVDSWGEELAGGVHSICLNQEGDQEFLYLAHHAHGKVYKYSLDGRKVWELGVPTESGKYQDAGRYKPTAVAVADDGSLWIADGYGLGWVHHYDAQRHYLESIGGPGDGDGQFRTPHGLP